MQATQACLARFSRGVGHVLASLGCIPCRAGDYAQALRCYERWLQLVPGSGPALANAAAAHLELGQWEQVRTS